MYYYLILALQGYCLYHMYTHRNPYYWFFIIMFIPVVGAVIYLITQVYNKRDAEKITNEITSIINPTKKIKDLEKHLQFSETYQNRVNLADAYLEIKDYNNAIPHYLEALEDQSQNQFYVTSKLIEAYYFVEDYDKVISYSNEIKNQSEFKKSRAQFILGLAQEKLGNFEAAETNLRQIDVRYSFYKERLTLAEFLISRDKIIEAKNILEAICNEAQHMTRTNNRIYRATILEAQKLLTELNK
jgi:hypothetical protein